MQSRSLFLLVVLIVVTAGSATGQWVENGFVPVVQSEDQEKPAICEAPGGGMVTTWADSRSGVFHIYAQRFDGSGQQMWATGGIPICTNAGGEQYSPVIASDGAGGAYIAWQDWVAATGDERVYAQYVDADGVIQYPVDGIALTASTGLTVGNVRITATDTGGPMVGWVQDAGGDPDIYAMKLTNKGRNWILGGKPVVVYPAVQTALQMAPKPGGGAFFVWQDYRNGGDSDIYAFTLDFAGNSDWISPSPSALVSEPGLQTAPQVIEDGLGGAFFAWEDDRAGNRDIYLTARTAEGYGKGPTGGLVVCSNTSSQEDVRLAKADDGCFVAWSDGRSGTGRDLYIQRVSWGMDIQLPVDGRVFCDATGNQFLDALLSDGAGGALAVFQDTRYDVDYDYFAQRVNASGYRMWDYDDVPLVLGYGYVGNLVMVSDGSGGLLATWGNYHAGHSSVGVHRLDRSGFWGYPAAGLAGAADVPGDQGGQVLVSWQASRLDPYPAEEIQSYSLWRALPEGAKASGQADPAWLSRVLTNEPTEKTPVIRAGAGDKQLYWELLDTVDAYGLPAYSRTLSTWQDSTGTDPALHVFQVITHHDNGDYYWVSDTVEGYSVDNLAPLAPAKLLGAGAFSPESLDLSWAPNTESDLHHYEIYRDTAPDFVPGPGTFLTATSDTTHVDAGWTLDGGWYYKVAAVDVHENASDFALLAPEGLTGAGDGPLPGMTVLRGNHPNPFNPLTVIEFDLKEAQPVHLRIFDLSGRLVRQLETGQVRSAGRHGATWNGRDDSGRHVAAGAYFYRLRAGDYQETKAMMLVK